MFDITIVKSLKRASGHLGAEFEVWLLRLVIGLVLSRATPVAFRSRAVRESFLLLILFCFPLWLAECWLAAADLLERVGVWVDCVAAFAFYEGLEALIAHVIRHLDAVWSLNSLSLVLLPFRLELNLRCMRNGTFGREAEDAVVLSILLLWSMRIGLLRRRLNLVQLRHLHDWALYLLIKGLLHERFLVNGEGLVHWRVHGLLD